MYFSALNTGISRGDLDLVHTCYRRLLEESPGLLGTVGLVTLVLCNNYHLLSEVLNKNSDIWKLLYWLTVSKKDKSALALMRLTECKKYNGIFRGDCRQLSSLMMEDAHKEGLERLLIVSSHGTHAFRKLCQAGLMVANLFGLEEMPPPEFFKKKRKKIKIPWWALTSNDERVRAVLKWVKIENFTSKQLRAAWTLYETEGTLENHGLFGKVWDDYTEYQIRHRHHITPSKWGLVIRPKLEKTMKYALK